jgi:hypothetical protein
MSDVDRELERALDAWRAETDGAVPPPELVPRIVRRAEAQASSMFAALATLGVRPLLAPSATAAVLVAWRSRNVLLTIAVGMAARWGWQAILAR